VASPAKAPREWLRFEEHAPKPKTKVFGVVSLHTGRCVGRVAWFAPWRRYGLYPGNGEFFDVACLRQVTRFCVDLMKERAEHGKSR
jgi:hypothetical protein